MANFKPLKRYLLILIDDLIKEHKLSAPFLDAGCGIGDASLHLAKRGWHGKAIDLSSQSIEVARKALDPFGHIEIKREDISKAKGSYKTILLLDVIEHEKNDEGLIKSLKSNIEPDGALIIATTIRQSEWRWDDDYYGHVRRYEISDLCSLLDKNGYEVIDVLDFTFPFFWLIRRVYTKVIPKKAVMGDNKNEQTINSSLQSAWERGIFSSAVERLIWWQPVFWLQKRFKRRLLGCECLLVARPK